jgi:hypothetical protein
MENLHITDTHVHLEGPCIFGNISNKRKDRNFLAKDLTPDYDGNAVNM